MCSDFMRLYLDFRLSYLAVSAATSSMDLRFFEESSWFVADGTGQSFVVRRMD